MRFNMTSDSVIEKFSDFKPVGVNRKHIFKCISKSKSKIRN